MKKFINSIYIFSKLSVVFVLLSVLIFVGYLFYISYVNEKKITTKTIEEEITIKDLIKNNSNKIEKLNFILNDLNNSIVNINKDIQLKNNFNYKANEESESVF